MERETTVLVVDDEQPLVDLVTNYLRREGYRIVSAGDGLAAVEKARTDLPDVVILDVMLPGIDGLEACRRIRRFSDAYILMLTARAEEIDRIIGLSIGADDYVTKPFSPRELVARVQALLRRPRSASRDGSPKPQRIGEMTIDRARYEIEIQGKAIKLTPREFNLVALLAEQPGVVYTRGQILDRVWGDSVYDDHVVEVHVANVRKKTEDDPAQPHYIQTIRGVGYRISADA